MWGVNSRIIVAIVKTRTRAEPIFPINWPNHRYNPETLDFRPRKLTSQGDASIAESGLNWTKAAVDGRLGSSLTGLV
jgi:hypothetical protein